MQTGARPVTTTATSQPIATTAGSPPFDFHAALKDCLPNLRQQAVALTRNRADADDLVQTAVVSALAAQGSFMPGTNFRAWMTRILRNRFISNIRARRENVALDDVPSGMMARSGGQEESLAMRELRHHLGRLPADQRLVLMLISVQGLSYDEVSEQLDVPVGTLKSRVFRARRQLQEWLLGEETSPDQGEDARGTAISGSRPGARGGSMPRRERSAASTLELR
jgi:RNA polymerase sigma-70 factor (ECF subfamily)